MNSSAVEFLNVYKKFRKGERNDSLRDLIPYLSKKAFLKSKGDKLQEREFWALKDVSFQLKKGEAPGIIGPNGAGKSTILKLLSGILRPNKGEIRIHGRLSALIEVGAGFHPDLTGRENIYLNGAILGMRKEEIRNRFDEIVEFSGISEFIDTPVKRYSSGMYARLGFSIAAHVDPEILLIYEVLSVGGFSFPLKLLELFSSNGVLSTSFRPGEWAKLKMTIESKIQIDNLVMSFYLKRNDGMVVFDASSDVNGSRFFSFHANRSQEIE